jgi:hypothetical protein
MHKVQLWKALLFTVWSSSTKIVKILLWIFFLCASRVCRFVLYTLLFELATNENQGSVGVKDCTLFFGHVSSLALFSKGNVTLVVGDNGLML